MTNISRTCISAILIKCKPIMIILFCLATIKLNAQVAVTATGGTLTQNYTTVAAAISAVNIGTHTGIINVAITSGSETAPATGLQVNASGTGSASYTALRFTVTTAGSYTIYAASGGTATPASASPDGIFALLGADSVTIDGFTLIDNNISNPSTMEYGIGLFKVSASNGCQNNIIKNNIISLKTINNATATAPMMDGSVGILLINSTRTAAITTLATAGVLGANSNNTIIANSVSFCNIGIGLSGTLATSNTNADINNVIGGSTALLGNNVQNFGGAGGSTNPSAGIRLLNQLDYFVRYNTINNNTGAVGAANHIVTNRGIYCATQATASFTISNNTVTMKNGAITAQISCIENVLSGVGIASLIANGNINGNTITNCAVLAGTTTGTFNGIINNGLAPFSLNINNNTFSNNSSGATSDSTNLIINTTASSAYSLGEINISNNSISGFSFTGGTAYTGVLTTIRQHLIAATPNAFKPVLNISENDITGITFTTTSTGANHQILVSGAGTAAQFYSKVRISKNNIHDLTLNHTGLNNIIISTYNTMELF